MDIRLIDAARTGNVGDLRKLIGENSLMLDVVALKGGDTPLHIASMIGHFDFVKEMLRLKPDFAEQLNQDGFSPMHMASANGHLEIVRELLKVDFNLCRLKGIDGRTPLHYAAIKGKIDVIREFLSACADSIQDATARGETALHLAVKKNQFGALRIMVEWIKELNKVDLLNMKDEQGNTVLHLAIARKHRQVIELLLNVGVVEVNATNESTLTALDILLIFESEAGDREIYEILRRAGAMRAREILSLEPAPPANESQVLGNNPSVSESSQPPTSDWEEFFKFKRGRDSPGDARNALLVIAILIVTATYQAGLSPPGGVWQEDSKPSDNNSTNTSKVHYAGEAILGSSNLVSFGFFMFSNSMGFFCSLLMIFILTSGFPMQLELTVSMMAMVITYDTAMNTIAPKGRMKLLFTIISIVMPIGIQSIFNLLRRSCKRLRQPLGYVRQESA
ncbi:hypothetical protein HHK36_028627 [Tetracentron sinense]|uniref:PGG domain-containing protein n=1 Tax=Tetracentron sinense TaxID=13715 RepID=A0A835D3M1_TETSI|nr:hypothetical protein HHK36_028627 [Tetracentron sinense]